MAGNVATYAGADYLASCTADIIKVGIGADLSALHALKPVLEFPVSSIRECAKVDRSIVADGGIRSPGILSRHSAFGADFAMVGSILAGTRPTPERCSPVLIKQAPKSNIKFTGDGEQGSPGRLSWRHDRVEKAEGVSTEVPYREDESKSLPILVVCAAA